jgi:hypothetical protein
MGDNLFAAMRAPQARAVFTGGAAATVEQDFFIADRPYEVTGVRQTHSVAGGSGAAVVVEKCTGTQAPAGGVPIHVGSFDLTATANTVQTALPSATAADRVLAAGDRLSIDFAGTLTGLVGLTIVVSLKPLQA